MCQKRIEILLRSCSKTKISMGHQLAIQKNDTLGKTSSVKVAAPSAQKSTQAPFRLVVTLGIFWVSRSNLKIIARSQGSAKTERIFSGNQ